MQMVFQDPLASLNPRKTILENVGEALLFHKLVSTREEQIKEVVALLEKVGLSPHDLKSISPSIFWGAAATDLYCKGFDFESNLRV